MSYEARKATSVTAVRIFVGKSRFSPFEDGKMICVCCGITPYVNWQAVIDRLCAVIVAISGCILDYFIEVYFMCI